MYQNLLLMFGEEILTDWRVYASSRRDFLMEIRETLKDITSKPEEWIKFLDTASSNYKYDFNLKSEIIHKCNSILI